MTPQERLKQIDAEIAQIDSVMGKSVSAPQPSNRLAQIDAELADIDNKLGIQKPQHPQEKLKEKVGTQLDYGAKLGKMIGSALSKGIISIADLPQTIASLGIAGGNYLGMTEREPYTKEEMPSHAIEQSLKGAGIDLNSVQPENAFERGLETAAEFGGSVLGGGVFGRGAKLAGAALLPKAAKSIPYVSKPVSKANELLLGTPESARELAAMTGLGTAVGAGTSALQEIGVNPLVAAATAALAPAGIGKAQSFRAARAEQIPLTEMYTKEFIKMGYPPELAAEEAMRMAKSGTAAKETITNVVGPENVPSFKEALATYKPAIEGYQPTTAEATGNLPLAFLERAKRGVVPELAEREALGTEALNKAMEKIMPEPGIPATQEYIRELGEALKETRGRYGQYQTGRAEKALEDLGAQLEPETAGKIIRGKLVANTEKRAAKRHEKTHHLYEKEKAIKEGIPVSNTKSYIDSELEVARGDIESALKKVKGMLKRNKIEDVNATPKIVAAQKEYDQMSKVAPNLVDKYYPNGRPEVPMVDVNPRPTEVDETIKVVSDMIEQANRTGANQLGLKLKEVKTNLLKDISTVPDSLEKRKLYRELSEPISKVTEHKKLKIATKQNVYKNEYAALESELPHYIIDDALKTPENARRYMTEIGKDKKAVGATEAYINHKVVRDVTDAAGNVIPAKIAKWKKDHPNYQNVYPGLESKLSNLTDAQIMANATIKSNEKAINEYYKKAAGTILDVDPDKVIQNILKGNSPIKKMKELKQLTAKNKSADEGLQRGIIEDFQRSITNAGVGSTDLNFLSYDKTRKYLSKNGKALSEALSRERLETLANIEKTLKGRSKVVSAGALNNSATMANAQNLNMLEMSKQLGEEAAKRVAKSSGLTGAATIGFIKYLKRIKNMRTDEVINKALVDHNYAKLLFSEPFKNKEATKSFIEQINKSYLITPIVTHKGEENE